MLNPNFRSRRSFLGGMAALAAIGSLPSSWARTNVSLPTRTHFSATSTDGVKLAVEAQGDPSAPEILFIHGLRQSTMSWDRQFDDPSLAGFRMVRFDLRGHGDSDKPSAPSAYSSLSQWGDDVAAVMVAARLSRPVLVGWSLGGAVVGGYLKRYGGAGISGVNLVDAVTQFTPAYLEQASSDFSRRTTSADIEERSEATAEFFRACFTVPPTGAELEAFLVMNGMTSPSVTAGLSLGREDVDPAFKAYRGPLLVTHGEKDRLLKVAMSEHNQAIHPGAQLSVYPGVGHSPFYEDAPRFNRELAAFVKQANRS